MKRWFQASAITCLLVVMASVAYATATTVRGSKSNSDNRVAVYDDGAMTPAQATAFLAEWDKIPLASTNEAAVRGILQRVLGAKAGSVKKIVIRTDTKPPKVIVLANPMLESEALAYSIPGTPSNQPTTGKATGSFPTPGGSALPAPPATRSMSTDNAAKIGLPAARINVQDCNAACQRQWGANASGLAECEARCRAQ